MPVIKSRVRGPVDMDISCHKRYNSIAHPAAFVHPVFRPGKRERKSLKPLAFSLQSGYNIENGPVKEAAA